MTTKTSAPTASTSVSVMPSERPRPPRRRRRWVVVLAVWAAWLAIVAGIAAAADDVTVYLSADEAMKLAFPGATRFDTVDVPVSPAIRAALGEKLGEPFTAEHVEVRRAFVSEGDVEKLAGRAVLNDDVGKYRPITYLVAADPAGKVVRVELLVYRESHGGQVRGRGFLEQYEGKGTADPLRVGKDITSISGATLSARAVSKGVKRTVLLLEALDAGAAASAGGGGPSAAAPAAPAAPAASMGAAP